MAFFVGFGVESECVFFNLLESEWSWILVSNYKIETKNEARVKYDFDVTIGFLNLEKFGVERSGSEYD